MNIVKLAMLATINSAYYVTQTISVVAIRVNSLTERFAVKLIFIKLFILQFSFNYLNFLSK
jgi:hypothetical protein